MNRWNLTEQERIKFMPIVKSFIEELENLNIDGSADLLEKDLSDTELNPSKLQNLLEELGYEVEDRDDNGWQLDFCITMTKDNCKTIQIAGCGMTFELMLSELE